MSGTSGGLGDVVGVIRHRLLVNRLADPAEVASRLPPGVRPFVTSEGGVVVGCCLIVIDSIRPWPMPASFGVVVRAAAHRISVVTGAPDSPTEAVYVPNRHTDNVLPVLFGGRLFPGAHRRADISIKKGEDSLAWSVIGRNDSSEGFDISVEADTTTEVESTSEVANVVIGTVLGVSPRHDETRLEGADMCLSSKAAKVVGLRDLRSTFLDSFSTAVPAETLLMTDVDVTWRRSSALIS